MTGPRHMEVGMGQIARRLRAAWRSLALFGVVVALVAGCSASLSAQSASTATTTPAGNALTALHYSPIGFETDGVWWVKCKYGLAANCQGHTFNWFITKDAPAVFVSGDGSTVVRLRGPDNLMNSIYVDSFNSFASHFAKLSLALQKEFLKLTGYCLARIGGAVKLSVQTPHLGPVRCYTGPA